ncbi:hypothetical protein [Rhodococcus koreensis]
MSTQYSVTGSVAIIHLDNPPVNGLPLSTRQGILRDLTRALDAPGIDSIVLTGNATDFGRCGHLRSRRAPVRCRAVATAGTMAFRAIAVDRCTTPTVSGATEWKKRCGGSTEAPNPRRC